MNILQKNPLHDKEFLNKLFYQNEREVYARITSLTFEEYPIEQIEGKITDGSVSLDGTSAVRRTCNLSMVAQDVNINEFYWGLSNKFKLEVGLYNSINPNYPEIIWFKQGIFVITQFNTSQTTNKWNIKIQGKDKMCLLNGEFSGQLPPTDFAREQYTDLDTGVITFKNLPIKTIIFKLLQEFALEQPHNIIINDIDESGQELLEYRGTEPLYLFKNLLTNEFDQISINKNLECYYKLPKEITYEQYYLIPKEYVYLNDIYVKKDDKYIFNEELAKTSQDYQSNNIGDWFKGKISDSMFITYNDLLDDVEYVGGQFATEIRLYDNGLLNTTYNLACLECGDIAGYRMSDLIYPGELKSNAGETITSILDKIKNKFTNFEYYYDVDGKFVFQKKTHYLDIPWNSEYGDNELFQNAAVNFNDISFSFTDSKLVVSYGNTPKLQNLKNDYSVHGRRDNIALRMRYAIDNKPTIYQPIRKLQENIITIIRDQNQNIISAKDDYKYYDAPEVQPYNASGLQGVNTAYTILYLLELRPYQENRHFFFDTEIEQLKSYINPEWCGSTFYDYWFNLFILNPRDETQIIWTGTPADVKQMLLYVIEKESMYGEKALLSIVPLDEGEKWTLICPQFAKYPYSTSYVILDEEGNMQLTSSLDNVDDSCQLIHYKVDWRELIYQMALDFRKLNMNSDYYYYLKEANPQYINNKTGYEQYYIDISLWRDLYNPNPKLQFNTQLNYAEVQQHTLLMDGDESNDNSDMIYIHGGYRLAEKTEVENLNYLNTYAFSKPIDSSVKSIYPYYTSNICKLDKNAKYYVEDEVTKKIQIAFDTETGKAIYDMLAYAAPQKIYIKNDVDLEPLSYSVSELQSEYEPFKYYFVNNEGYYELSTSYQEGQTYYELRPLAYTDRDGFDIQTSSGTTDFTVLEYPYSETFDEVYGTSIATNYAIFADTHFKDKIESMLERPVWQNTTLFVKNNDYEKLSKDNPLWNLYYRSAIYLLSYKTMDLIHSIDNQIKNVSGFLSNPILYLNQNLDILKKYILYLETLDYSDIKNILFNILYNELTEVYIPHILTLSNQNYDADRSCLSKIFIDLNQGLLNIDNMISKLSDMEINDKLLYIITILLNMNKNIQVMLNSISKNYDQVTFIINNSTLKTYLAGDESDPRTQYTTIQNIDGELEKIQLVLESTKQSYLDNQNQKTLTVLKNIREDIADMSKIEEDTEITSSLAEEINRSYNQTIDDVSAMLSDIQVLKTIIEAETKYIMELYAWTPDPYTFGSLSVTQEEYDTFIDPDATKFEWDDDKELYTYTDNISKLQTLRTDVARQNNILYEFLEGIENLKSIFSCTTASQIIDVTTINGSRVFRDILDPLLESSSVRDTLTAFEANTSCFQEHIIRENVDNFNYVKDSKLVNYEPIAYYKASYDYNRNQREGNFWLKEIFTNPQSLTFWFDFLEPTSLEMSKYAVPAIGCRSTVVNDKDVKSVTYQDIPQIVFTTSDKDVDRLSGYTYINLTKSFANLFAISSKGKTAKERIDELLYQHSYCSENISISTIPIYTLMPNQTIYVRDDKSNINGKYIISKLTIPLNYKKTMSINATKFVDSIT